MTDKKNEDKISATETAVVIVVASVVTYGTLCIIRTAVDVTENVIARRKTRKLMK